MSRERAGDSTTPEGSEASRAWDSMMQGMVTLFQQQGQAWSRFLQAAASPGVGAGAGARAPGGPPGPAGVSRASGPARDRQGAPGGAARADFATQGNAEALRGWSVLVQTMLGFLQQQGLSLSELFRSGLSGELRADQLVNFSFDTWLRGLSMMLGPGQALGGSVGQVPSLVFIVDRESEVSPAQVVPLRGVGPDATVSTTDVVRVGGPFAWSTKRKRGVEKGDTGEEEDLLPGVLKSLGEDAVVRGVVTPDGSQIEVSLVGLSGQSLEPGLYAGMVYSRRAGESRRVPQAFIWVFAALDTTRKGVRHPSRKPGRRTEPDPDAPPPTNRH